MVIWDRGVDMYTLLNLFLLYSSTMTSQYKRSSNLLMYTRDVLDGHPLYPFLYSIWPDIRDTTSSTVTLYLGR